MQSQDMNLLLLRKIIKISSHVFKNGINGAIHAMYLHDLIPKEPAKQRHLPKASSFLPSLLGGIFTMNSSVWIMTWIASEGGSGQPDGESIAKTTPVAELVQKTHRGRQTELHQRQ